MLIQRFNQRLDCLSVILGSTEASGVPVSAMKLVRRWMRNPKVSVEKAQGKGLLYPCPKCPLAEDLCYAHFPSPYGCCHYTGLQGCQYYHQEPSSPCPASGHTSGHDKSKGCKVRKWRMLARHHGDGTGKQKEAESDIHLGCCQSWGIHASPLLASPVMLECSICSGPYISYTLEDTWQPRQRTQAEQRFLTTFSSRFTAVSPWKPSLIKTRHVGTQLKVGHVPAMDLYYHNESDLDSYCCPGDNSYFFNSQPSG
eukprot:superscaffoldBa00001461_g10661